ncbi:MAG TPA: hypothetical protein PK747_07805 [Acidobacteriota bacterium]|nr:hypothetical protein [Acidobacteriota bacterium]HNT18140.1 hypothetical protein [Acidobacteriota bacterium]HPA27027.1 hypothetical protein [Acidobacteriota bacterium]HQO20419.1 hypothetical protein [Acidobacteriota bacterium]HQQ47295.1 hypothetical protein [Acidobacteriota bacterium]
MDSFLPSKKIRAGEKGSSLVEVLIALFVLMVLLIGILQMFSAAFVINQKSSLKTLQAYKCQQVAENIRMARLIIVSTGNPPLNSGITFNDGFVYPLPYESGDDGWAYWGPAGANVVEEEGAKYRLYYRMNQQLLLSGASVWNLTVTAVEAAKIEAGEDPYDDRPNLRRVEYVTQMPGL